ncbi:murein DD-endopeptidase MepM/ murein hydrolase activator NlpD [Pedobacter africanus]|uniref:Murein DD-endopeptidase MepM/ murein hydrolase activator NlpD n=1 Tax=Pedobacter africanus TaxID=151894 RepID=A0ACC6L287_9SPHI|nr:M23 family metallopeptidase [Pedobacter africanus]MDR6785446.1 murein DD-endopeptidase MepM/ murein hydrolase activator NlpD [Pedobacter africanus]
MIRICILLAFLALQTIGLQAQQLFSNNKYPLVDFRPPLDIVPPALAGSFGELRANHFHSGMDYRTNQREGYPVYAIADGYISRLRVQNSGFGLALYINHQNGYTSVYGHLQRFGPKIAQQVKTIQYQKKSYEIDEFPNSLQIPVRKGEVIAYTGNSGSSGGPHLHFEIRDTKTEATINPQLFGLEIPDNIPPVIYSMYVYRLNKKPFNEFTPKQYFQVVGAAGTHHLNKVNTINLGGEVGFGIITTDKHNGASGTNGVYSIELELDGKLVYVSSLEKFSFDNSRGINSHIDYPTYLNTKRSIQKSFVDPGNPLKIYSNLVNNGRIEFTDGAKHQLKYTVTDGKGNKSTLAFNVQADASATISSPDAPAGSLNYSYANQNEFNNDEIKVIIPKGTLYNDLNFIYKKLPKPTANAYSAVHQIHNTLTPLHTGFELWIRADSSLNKYKDKALIVNTGRSSQGGYFENGYVKAKPRTFGSYFITVDTIPPTITPVNIAEGKSMAGISKMSFKIRDNLSGIKSFNGYIDGRWILMEFDTKSASLWHSFDDKTTPGKHTLEIIVSDMKDNNKNYSITFYK